LNLSEANEFILQVDFPAFTVCSAGFANQNLAAGFYKEYLNFLEENGAKVNATPYYIASVSDSALEVTSQSFFLLVKFFITVCLLV
jgi:hypothetical protein